MSYPLSFRMSEILAFTNSGKVREATALIQHSLGFRNVPSAPRETATDKSGNAIALIANADGSKDSGGSADDSQIASFDRRSLRNAAGTLDYLLYRPRELRQSVPLVIMLHGCTQSAEDFACGTRMNALADELGFIVAYPEQPRSANIQKCWNWFRPSDQGKSSGEPAVIAAITREIIAAESVDPQRVYVAGLSAGGAAAAIMVDAFPDLYAAAGIHSGLACGSAKDLPSALAAMRGGGSIREPASGKKYVPTITFHGDRDNTVHSVNSDQIHAAWKQTPAMEGLKREVSTHISPSGGTYRKTVMLDAEGRSISESWLLEGAGHAWSGGSPTGSYTDKSGPEASREMLRFFLQHRLG